LSRLDSLKHRILKRTELAPEAAGISRIVLIDDKSVYIENHRGVKEYVSTKICIELGSRDVVVEGEDLKLEGFYKHGVSISGTIAALKFESGTNERRILR